MKHLPPQSHKRPIYTDHLPLVQSHNTEPHDQLSHRLLANIQHWQLEEIACMCVRERSPRVHFNACVHTCLLFTMFCCECCYLHMFMIFMLSVSLPRITHSSCDWSMQGVFALSKVKQHNHKPQEMSTGNGDNVCLCVCWKAELLTHVYVQKSMWSLSWWCLMFTYNDDANQTCLEQTQIQNVRCSGCREEQTSLSQTIYLLKIEMTKSYSCK